MSERSGIEIDYCPTCRGVWLDRGELDKLIERSLTHAAPAPPPVPAAPQAASYQGQQQHQHQQSYQQPYQQPHRKKRKESWLSELFD